MYMNQRGFNTILIIAISVAVVSGGFAYWYFGMNKADTNSNTNQVVCDADAKLCPDGSYVSRVTPTCEFAACPETNTNTVTNDNTNTVANTNTTVANTNTSTNTNTRLLNEIEIDQLIADYQAHNLQVGTFTTVGVIIGYSDDDDAILVAATYDTEADTIPMKTTNAHGQALGQYIIGFKVDDPMGEPELIAAGQP